MRTPCMVCSSHLLQRKEHPDSLVISPSGEAQGGVGGVELKDLKGRSYIRVAKNMVSTLLEPQNMAEIDKR